NTDPTSFITGTINRVKVTIGDTSAYINTVPFGPECEFDKCYDKLVLTGTVLAGLSTDKVVLSDFSVLNADYNNYYALGEITVDALPYTGPGPDTSPVPEPSTYAMLLAGLGLTGAIARHRARRQG
ncbi:MAG TPA: PEP-CTERM sorting domain-containing protein, partial [Duganella sp.]|nr:PEP-CTERM sorting domain-containing protein [Duganella sp.]